MIDFKLEVGAFYRTRDNRKVECLKKDLQCAEYTIAMTDGANVFVVNYKGQHNYKVENCNDIVGIWEEPKPKRLCYVEREFGSLKMFTEEELKNYTIRFSDNKLERFPCALDET